MQYPSVGLSLISPMGWMLWVATALVLMPTCTLAQDLSHDSSDSGELMTMLLPDRIALPIGDQGQRLEVSVYVPHNYTPGDSYPVLVVLDADPLLGLLKTLNFLWIEERKTAPVILVGLPFGSSAGSIWANRSHYLLPLQVGVVDYYGSEMPLNSGGGAADLASFIQGKVLPRVLEKYSVDRNRVGLAAFSMGGLFAAWHMVNYPEVFTDYLIIAPPLAAPFIDSSFGRATQKLRRRGFGRPTRLYVAYAENDLKYVLTGASAWAAGWQEFEGANLTFRSEIINDHRHDAGAIPALINGFKFLYKR